MQISSRRENLKRHLGRFHKGMGEPLLRYISGNSILIPEETSSTLRVFPDEYATRARTKVPILHPYPEQMQSKHSMEDRLFKLIELQATINQSRYQNKSTYFAHNHVPHHDNVRSSSSVYFRNKTAFNQQKNIGRNYDDVSGFKVDICTNCLEFYSRPILSNDAGLQKIHKCTPGMEAEIKTLSTEEFSVALRKIVNMFPELLFNECQDWASSINGLIYLTATKTDKSDESDTQNENILVDYDSLPILKRVLSESKIKLTNAELLEFLELAINQTKIMITLRGQPDQANQNYMLEVSVA